MIPAALLWVLVVIAFVVLEGITVQLVSIWFAVGATASLLVSLVTSNGWVQMWTFVIVSLLCLLALKPIAAKYFAPKSNQPTNADRVVGKEAIVKEDICNLENRGLIQVMGQDWTARSELGMDIPAGTPVLVDRIEGVKVFVTPKVMAVPHV